jgi:hypothetical protein
VVRALVGGEEALDLGRRELARRRIVAAVDQLLAGLLAGAIKRRGGGRLLDLLALIALTGAAGGLALLSRDPGGFPAALGRVAGLGKVRLDRVRVVAVDLDEVRRVAAAERVRVLSDRVGQQDAPPRS